MTSAEKILAGIITSAEKSAAEIIAAAEKKAADIKAEAVAQAQKDTEAALASAEKKAELIRETGKSGAALVTRDASLSCRREQIDLIIAKTAKSIKALPDGAYFDFLFSVVKNGGHKKGVMLLSAGDLKRDIPALKKMLSDTEIELSDIPADIDGGFILKQGDIEINASLGALVHEKYGLLVDEINNIIRKG